MAREEASWVYLVCRERVKLAHAQDICSVRAVLCCVVLCCNVLYCTVLYSTVDIILQRSLRAHYTSRDPTRPKQQRQDQPLGLCLCTAYQTEHHVSFLHVSSVPCHAMLCHAMPCLALPCHRCSEVQRWERTASSLFRFG